MWFSFQCFWSREPRNPCQVVYSCPRCTTMLEKGSRGESKQPNTVLTLRKRKGCCESFLGTFQLCRRITSAVSDAIFPAHSASIACGLTLSRRILKKPMKLRTIWRIRTLSDGPHLLQEKLAMGTQFGGRRTAGNCHHTEPELEQKSVRSFLIH